MSMEKGKLPGNKTLGFIFIQSLQCSLQSRYFSHALTLRDTILFLRQNSGLSDSNMCLGLDLVRCESLQSLDSSTASRLLNKNYS